MTIAEILNTSNAWVVNHKELLTVVAVPILVGLVTHLLNKSAERRAEKERQMERSLARELKLSEFRQAWIDELRRDLSELSAMLPSGKSDHEVTANAKIASILLRMNPSEGPSQKVFEDLMALKTECEKKTKSVEVIDDKYLALLNSSNKLLKEEWDRLKADLREASGVKVQ